MLLFLNLFSFFIYECFENWKDNAKLTCEQFLNYKTTEEDRLYAKLYSRKKVYKMSTVWHSS